LMTKRDDQRPLLENPATAKQYLSRTIDSGARQDRTVDLLLAKWAPRFVTRCHHPSFGDFVSAT
jgi:hypothetical protein